MPPDIFEFQIPEGARIHDHDKHNRLLNNPEHGIPTEGLTEQEAAREIATQYYNALITDDFSTMQKVRPMSQPTTTPNEHTVELVEVGKLYVQNGCGIGKILPCRLRFKDGSLKEFKLIIRVRNIDNQPSCVIAGTWGGAITIEE